MATTKDVLFLVGQILEAPNLKLSDFAGVLERYNAALEQDRDETGNFGFNTSEITALAEVKSPLPGILTDTKPFHPNKVKVISENRRRTGRSLSEVVEASKELFKKMGWQW